MAETKTKNNNGNSRKNSDTKSDLNIKDNDGKPNVSEKIKKFFKKQVKTRWVVVSTKSKKFILKPGVNDFKNNDNSNDNNNDFKDNESRFNNNNNIDSNNNDSNSNNNNNNNNNSNTNDNNSIDVPVPVLPLPILTNQVSSNTIFNNNDTYGMDTFSFNGEMIRHDNVYNTQKMAYIDNLLNTHSIEEPNKTTKSVVNIFSDALVEVEYDDENVDDIDDINDDSSDCINEERQEILKDLSV